MRSRPTRTAFAAWLALAAATPACAQLIGCRFQSPPNIAFGTYVDGQLSTLHTTVTLEVRCHGRNAPLAVSITAGPGSNSGDMQDRRMLHKREAGELMRYQLFVDSARTRVWGDGTRGTEAIVVSTPDKKKIATVYAEMPANQGGVEGDYEDRIQITVLP